MKDLNENMNIHPIYNTEIVVIYSEDCKDVLVVASNNGGLERYIFGNKSVEKVMGRLTRSKYGHDVVRSLDRNNETIYVKHVDSPHRPENIYQIKTNIYGQVDCRSLAKVFEEESLAQTR